MNHSRRFLLRMMLFLMLVVGLAVALGRPLVNAFMGNPGVNGVILVILLSGIVYIFRQVLLLDPEIDWIESFRYNRGDDEQAGQEETPPRLLAPMARMLGTGQGRRVSLSASSLQTLLDGIGSRLAETRETSRYLIGVLIFLGLLGTFYGLLETVRSVGGVLGGLSVGGSDAARAFADLKSGLESPLAGMSTAFSSSLFGLAGSLVLGFLDLQAGQAQNRFYNDLEEWLSTYTRLSGGQLGDSGDGSVPAYIQALLEQTADSLENLQRILARSEESRIGANATLASLTDRTRGFRRADEGRSAPDGAARREPVGIEAVFDPFGRRRRGFARTRRCVAQPPAQHRGLSGPPDRRRGPGTDPERSGIARGDPYPRAHDCCPRRRGQALTVSGAFGHGHRTAQLPPLEH